MATPAARIAGLALAAALAPLPAPAAGEDSARPHSGAALPYEVAAGLAIHDGDIVLGPAAVSPAAASRPGRREIARPYYGAALWSEGVVPYVIDDALPPGAAESVRAAIEEWNAKTVITLAPRVDETDYVRFAPSDRCAASVGRRGGEQKVWSGREGTGCGPSGMAHEIGHAVGLSHEHQRMDRDARLIVRGEDLHGPLAPWVARSRLAAAPYDYRSVMHYDPWHWETIPPGIEIGLGGLSDGDIDGVARLYGQPPEDVTVATNPPGLEVLVDGIPTTAPAQFDWERGSVHTLEVPAEPQERPGSRYLFGTWNDGAPRRRSVIAGAGGTWLEANFIAQRRVTASVSPPGAGRVDVAPAGDGWHTRGSRIRAEALGERLAFWRWNRWSPHGLSSNPAEIQVRDAPVSLVAYFSAGPLFGITSNVPSFVLDLDARWHLAPTALAVPRGGRSARVRIADTQRARGRADSRYRFEGWSDGVEDREREIALPREGGELAAAFATEHALWLAAQPRYGGAVSAAPPSEDGYYAEGTAVTALAAPNEGWELARWTGPVLPRALVPRGSARATVRMDGPRAALAWFTRTRQLKPGAPEAVSLPTDEPGFRFAAPEGASGIALRFAPDGPAPGTELRVRAFSGPLEPGLAAWERLHARTSWQRDRLRDADFAASATAAHLEVAISPHTDPPLDPDALYFVVLAGDGTPVSGTLSLEVTSSGPRPPRAKAWPRAFTFVSEAGTDPSPQNFELRNEGGSAMHFEAAPAAAWLAADPPRGSVAPGESLELAVRVTGQVPADTHAATLDLSLDGPYGALPQLRLPVTFVAIPPPAALAVE